MFNITKIIFACILLFAPKNGLRAQTDIDGVFMAPKNLCTGLMYSHGSWKHYWEGTYYRENLNLGRVSTQSLGLMGSYGVMKDVNLLFSVPYVSTKASAGTMTGLQGFQDVSLFAKARMLKKDIGNAHLNVIGVLGVSTPMSNYVKDFQPMSIGMGSTNGIARIMFDLTKNNLFATVSASFIGRSNIKIDRTAYYTTEMHYTNEVAMPDIWTGNLRLGYRKDDMILEAVVDRMNTIGGFDIRKNDMPFPSNNMDNVRAGVSFKIPVPIGNGLALVGSSMYTLSGRNVGQSFQNMIGLFCVLDFNKEVKK